MSIILALILFSVIVISHEWGHMIAAKKVGVLVEEFSVGMGPKLFSRKKGETEYSFRAIPMGGFCRMQGEIEDMDEEADDYEEKVKNFDPKRSYYSKSILQRAFILVAGPAMNIILAFILLFILLATSGFLVPGVGSVFPDSPAYEAGLQAGDGLYALNGSKISVYEDYGQIYSGITPGEPVELTVLRDGEKININMTPEYSEEDGRYLFGFTFDGRYGVFSEPIGDFEQAGFMETISTVFGTMGYYVKSIVIGFIRLITLNVNPQEVAGPIGIVNIVGDTFEAGLQYSIKDAILNLCSFAAFLSTNLGVLNLFPIPALDGGKLLFIIVEAVRRKPMNQELEGKINFIGFALLILLMVVIGFNDIVNLIR